MSSRNAGASVLAVFLVLALLHLLNAATLPVWAPFIPEIGRNLEVGPAALGTAFLGQPLGLIAGGLIGGLIVRWAGLRPGLVIGALGYWAPLPLAGLAGVVAAFDKPQALFFVLVAVGVGNGIYDVAWGTFSTALEQRSTRRTHVGIQVAIPIGAFLGALGGSFSDGAGVSVFMHLTVFAVAAILLAIPATLLVLPKLRGGNQEPASHQPAQLPGRSLWGLATICLLGGLLLGAAYTWSVAILEGLGAVAGPTGSSAGLIAFIVAQALTLLVVGLMPRTAGSPRTMIALGGLVAAGGAALVVTSPKITTVVIGFAVLGLGVALTWPVAQSAAAEGFANRRAGVMSFMIVAMYIGLALAPFVIGQMAERMGLKPAMAVTIAGSLAIVLLAVITIPGRERHQRWHQLGS